ncbi:MAG: pseudouridine synthase [Flavobacteriaceae bacterium]
MSQRNFQKNQGKSKRKGDFSKRPARTYRKPKPQGSQSSVAAAESGLIRLNKYLANSGICSRREADTFIAAGSVSVNGKTITEMGFKVKKDDTVRFDGRVIIPEKKEYILLNKPKNFITTTRDEKGRRTVMELISKASKSRLVPVGRLDRNTTGLLLFTNDGDLAKKLTHPKHQVRKIYHVELNKNLASTDFNNIQKGLTLDDGPIKIDEVTFIENKPKKEVGIEIHSGRNRIVRRIFEHLGYKVVKLDRVVLGGLTKKDLPRGHWRRLTAQEEINLRMLK